MKVAVFSGIILWVFASCSFDAERFIEENSILEEAPEVNKNLECYSCMAKDGIELEICDHLDGTYTLYHGDIEKPLTKDDLEGHSAKDFVSIGCQLEDLEL